MSHRVVGVEMRRTDDVRRSRMYVYRSRDRRVAAKPRSNARPIVRNGTVDASMTKTPSGPAPAPAYRRSPASAASYEACAGPPRNLSRCRVISDIEESDPVASQRYSEPVAFSGRPSTRVDARARERPQAVGLPPERQEQGVGQRPENLQASVPLEIDDGCVRVDARQSRAESARAGAHSIRGPIEKNTRSSAALAA